MTDANKYRDSEQAEAAPESEPVPAVPLTLNSWAAIVSHWADSKGWWEPQCPHEDTQLLNVLIPGQTPALEVLWCKNCGAMDQIEFAGVDSPSEWHLPAAAKERNRGELLMLMVTELAETLEEIRHHHSDREIYIPMPGDRADYSTEDPTDAHLASMINLGYKPEGVPIELADTIIRILDWAGHSSIDLDAAIALKMAYNEKRPYRHGGLAS